MIRAKKKAADSSKNQQPRNTFLDNENITTTEDAVKRFEYLLSLEMYRRDYAAGNWQGHHYH